MAAGATAATTVINVAGSYEMSQQFNNYSASVITDLSIIGGDSQPTLPLSSPIVFEKDFTPDACIQNYINTHNKGHYFAWNQLCPKTARYLAVHHGFQGQLALPRRH